jgi:hypothetical protein
LAGFALLEVEFLPVMKEDVEAQGHRHGDKGDQDWFCVIGDDRKNQSAIKSA